MKENKHKNRGTSIRMGYIMRALKETNQKIRYRTPLGPRSM